MKYSKSDVYAIRKSNMVKFVKVFTCTNSFHNNNLRCRVNFRKGDVSRVSVHSPENFTTRVYDTKFKKLIDLLKHRADDQRWLKEITKRQTTGCYFSQKATEDFLPLAMGAFFLRVILLLKQNVLLGQQNILSGQQKKFCWINFFLSVNYMPKLFILFLQNNLKQVKRKNH